VPDLVRPVADVPGEADLMTSLAMSSSGRAGLAGLAVGAAGPVRLDRGGAL
jgi:hypothetical protein